MFEYRFHRSISGSRIYPCNSRYFHPLGRIVSYCWRYFIICCRVSPPTLRSFRSTYQLRSDNGPQFIADVIWEFLHLIGVSQTLTLAYSTQENAIVERYNKEINRHLRALTFENLSLTDYKKSVPFLQRILNSNHSDSSKISASEILFGNMLNLDKGIFIPQSERSSASKPLSQYMSDLLAIQDNLLKASAMELLRNKTFIRNIYRIPMF